MTHKSKELKNGLREMQAIFREKEQQNDAKLEINKSKQNSNQSK